MTLPCILARGRFFVPERRGSMIDANHPVVNLLVDLGGSDLDRAAKAEVDLWNMVQAGDAMAHRGVLGVLNVAESAGEMPFADYAYRVGDVLKTAYRQGILADVLAYRGEPDLCAPRHSVFLAILDRFADDGDDLAAAALMFAAQCVPAVTVDASRQLRAGRMRCPDMGIPDAEIWCAMQAANALVALIVDQWDFDRAAVDQAMASLVRLQWLSCPLGWAAQADAIHLHLVGALPEQPLSIPVQ